LILAGLSAGLPLLTDQPSLISANAMAVTGGSILVVLGGGLGFGIRKVFESVSNANHSDAVIILVASAGYFLASLFTLRLSKYEIGPLEHEKKSPSFTQGFIEMRDGFSFLNRHPDALRGIFATAVQRGSLTALLLLALLLERNTFHSPDNPDAGLSGLALALSIAGIGITCGALIAPLGVSRLGRHRWIRLMILLNTLPPIILVFVQQPIPLYIVAFLGSFFGQSLKVTNDALVQSKINDYFRGRVFAVYDVVVNGAIVSGALIAALILPASGISVVLPLMVSAFSLLIGVRVLRKSKFNFVS
jgi:hypothetical protein